MEIVTVRLTEEIKRKLEQIAEKQGVPVNGLIRQLIDRYLEGHDIDWQEEEPEE